MPSETYLPQKKFKRSKRHRARLIRRFWGLLGLISVYFLVTWSLDRLDDTPRWANVSFPPFVVHGAPYGVDVKYHNLPHSSHIKARMAITGNGMQSLGGLQAEQDVTVAKTHGSAVFVFQIPSDPNASFIDFAVSCDSAPMREKNSGQNSVISSGRIPILSADDETILRAYNQPGWQNVIADAIEHGYWIEKRGDPTAIGWGITIFYVFAGVMCLFCTGFMDSRRKIPISQVYAWFWWLMTGLLVFMGINKQLDLQLLLADIGRAFTQHQGWYGQRKPVQIRVLALGACVCLAGLQAAGYRLKSAPKSTWLALCGILLLGLNILIHLVSLHSIERVLTFSLAGLSVGDGIEILSILWIVISAQVYNRTQREEVSYILQ